MYPIDTSPDLIVSIQTTELSNYAIGLMYQYAFPQSLLKELSKSILDAMNQCGFSIASPESISEKKDENEMKILYNEAWNRFWRKSPDEFRKWEENKITELKKQAKSTTIVN